jgi:ABC-type nitrate/sulfonate/bicarbonate transport system substrate-binding protein
MNKFNRIKKGRPKLRLGFVPLNDAAPLIMAQELGLFARYGIDVELSREVGWATICDKIIFGELEAAHSLAGLPFSATLGLGSVRCDCVTALVFNLHGNGITLSEEFWQRGIRDARGLGREVARVRRERTFTFGVTFPFSTHNFLLRHWLGTGGINPDKDVRIVVVPPPQMFNHLEAHNLDGYCVGEPWNSAAIQKGIGFCAAASADLAPRHPEKVLMVRRQFVEKNPKEHLALVAALIKACAFCDCPENHDQIVATLSQERYLNAPAELLRPGVTGVFNFGHGRVETVSDFTLYHRDGANSPSAEKASWVLRHLIPAQLPGGALVPAAIGTQVFRMDLFEQALNLVEPIQTPGNEIENETTALTV